ncbi:hypothetical protein BaRGS_00017503 [Batillaria attramentaria]|uniref:Uncharacterized protein n=1 Tax=Batillaria attramentaria TaxID=370345 RepID=A0ABD0KWW9_9CAEN
MIVIGRRGFTMPCQINHSTACPTPEVGKMNVSNIMGSSSRQPRFRMPPEVTWETRRKRVEFGKCETSSAWNLFPTSPFLPSLP